jgi:hypothetical protein
MKVYLMRVLAAGSTLLNVILGGPTNQTFSARNYERKRHGKNHITFIIDLIFFSDPEHCLGAWVTWSVQEAAMKEFERNKEKQHGIRKSPYDRPSHLI